MTFVLSRRYVRKIKAVSFHRPVCISNVPRYVASRFDEVKRLVDSTVTKNSDYGLTRARVKTPREARQRDF